MSPLSLCQKQELEPLLGSIANYVVHANTDVLSRLPLPGEPVPSFEHSELVLLNKYLEESPVIADAGQEGI